MSVTCIIRPCQTEIFQISHLQSGVVAASEDDFVVDINTLDTFIMQFLFSYFGQTVEVPDLDRKFIPGFTGLVVELT